MRNRLSTLILSRRGWIATVLSAVFIVFITTNFYEYRTVKALQVLTDVSLSQSGWTVERNLGPENAFVELERPRVHLP